MNEKDSKAKSINFSTVLMLSYPKVSLLSRADSTDFLETISPSVPIVRHSRQVFQTTFCVRTKLKQISSSWLTNTGTSLYWGPVCLVRLNVTISLKILVEFNRKIMVRKFSIVLLQNHC